jgi:putative endonuclease
MVFHVYILSNKFEGCLYIGVTNDIARRVYEHKQKIHNGFVKKYCLIKLVYAEECDNIHDAITREKQLKNWHREWKINLINSVNPNWDDWH